MPKAILFCEKHRCDKSFSPYLNKKTGIIIKKYVCKMCATERSAEWRLKNKERYKKLNSDGYQKRKTSFRIKSLQDESFFHGKSSEVLCFKHNVYKVFAADNGLICRECKKDYAAKYRQLSPMLKYGVTKAVYNDMRTACKNKCEICFQPETRMFAGVLRRLSIDHVHDDTQKVRGLLCQQCNVMIGNAKDSIEILQSAITYLKKHDSK